MNFIIQLIVGLVFSLASTLIKSMFQQDQKQKVPGVRGSIQTGGDNPLSFIMGFYATGGHLKYAGTWGNAGETPNAYYSKVVSVSDLPIRGFAGFFVNGERVTLAPTQTGDLGYAVLEYRVSGKDHLWIKPYNGDQTAADPLMRAKFGSDPDRPYTAAMIGRGVAYFVATALVNRELFTNFPEYLAEVNGIPLDDPRGDNRHDNPMVGVYTLMKGIKFDGKWVYGPQNITDANFVYANLEAQMDKCDTIRPGTSERRFRFGYEVSVDAEPHAVIGEFLKACEGRIAEVGGIYKFLVGEPDAPVVSITDEDIVITQGQSYEPFPGFENLFNGIGATYPEPAEGWQSKEAPPRYRSDLEALDDGRRLPFTTEYKAAPFALQVQELMRAAIEEVRRFRKTTKTMPPEWWEFEPLDSYIWTSARNGFVNKQFLITAMDDLPNGNQFVGDQEVDPSDYDWQSDYELPWNVAPLVISRPAPQPVSGPSVAPVPGELAYDVFWSAPSVTVDVEFVRVSHRALGATDPRWTGLVPKPDLLTGSARVAVALHPAETVEVQLEYIPRSGRATIASAWMTVTIADVRIGPDDLTDGLREELETINAFLDEDLPSITDDLADLEAARADIQDRIDQITAELADITGLPEWDVGTAYGAGDMVRYDGGLYRAFSAPPTGTLPTDPAYWEKIGEYASLGEAVAALTLRVNIIDGAIEATQDSIRSTTHDGRRIHNTLMAAALTNGDQGASQIFATADQFAANASIIQESRTEISRVDGVLSVHASELLAVNAAISGKVDTTVFQELSSTVSAHGDDIYAQGQLIQSVQSDLAGKADASTLASMDTEIKETAQGLTVSARDSRSISSAMMAAALLNGDQGAAQVFGGVDQRAATAEVNRVAKTEIARVDGNVTVLAEEVSEVRSAINTTVAEAISTVTTQVNEVDGRVTAESQRVDALRAVIGDSAAEVLMKGEVMNGPGGPNSRWAIRLQTTNNGTVVAIGMLFIDIIGGVATIGLQANRSVFYADDGTPLALVDGATKTLRSSNGALILHLVTGDVVSTGNFSFG